MALCKGFLHLYLLPFENTENDPTIDWIAPGLSDMAREQLKNEFGINLNYNSDLFISKSELSTPEFTIFF